MLDAVDELIEFRKQNGISASLNRVHRFHKANPHVLDFLVQELQRVRDNRRMQASVGSLWHYARWVLTENLRVPGENFEMPNNLFPHYERMIVILHPEFNGLFEMATCKADADFGTMLEPASKSKHGHIRHLQWADGKAMEQGWRPSKPHKPKPVHRRKYMIPDPCPYSRDGVCMQPHR
jgi:hypothetical protein